LADRRRFGHSDAAKWHDVRLEIYETAGLITPRVAATIDQELRY